MAGFWHLSHHQMRNPNGAVYANAKATFYEAASLEPIVVYQDYGLGTAHPNPVSANAYGIFPPVFLDEEYSFYRQRITDRNGVIIPGTDVGILPIIGPGEGGGGGSETPVDPTALFQTGDVMWLDVSGTRPGWVRDNGRSIGSATSGASERANADTAFLFSYLWQTFPDAVSPVSGGRGLSASADFAANKTIGLPDKRGFIAGGLDDMGNTSASRYTGVPITYGGYNDPGAKIGEPTHLLSVTEMPSHTHVNTLSDPGHTHANNRAGSGGTTFGYAAINSPTGTENAASATTGITLTNASAGGGAVHNVTQRTVLGTFFRKL